MRYLGIDYGSKRVGVAITDEEGKMAFPLKVLENKEDLIYNIILICKEKNINEIVVGESKDFSQQNNKIMDDVVPFVENLKKSSALPVFTHTEFMTSQEAERLQGKNDMLDASAAAIILKSYLDSSAH